MIAVKTVTSKWRERKFIVGAGLNIRDGPGQVDPAVRQPIFMVKLPHRGK